MPRTVRRTESRKVLPPVRECGRRGAGPCPREPLPGKRRPEAVATDTLPRFPIVGRHRLAGMEGEPRHLGTERLGAVQEFRVHREPVAQHPRDGQDLLAAGRFRKQAVDPVGRGVAHPPRVAARSEIGIFTTRWNAVIGGQLFSKSLRGSTVYEMQLLGMEGSFTALACLMSSRS
jgi:hypothetical protein